MSKELSKPPVAPPLPTRASVNFAVIRFCCWMVLLLGSTLWIIPEFENMFEEFEINIPAVTQQAIFVSQWARATALLFVPFTVVAMTLVEVGTLFVPDLRTRRALIRVDLILMACVILAIVVTLGIPLIAVIQALGG